jgi:hypothetical protein
LLERVWSIKPPDPLVRTFSTSHAFLHERLTSEFVSGLTLAVATDKELAMLRSFEEALPALCTELAEIPLYVANSDMVRSNTTLCSDGRVSVMLWGRWRLAPIGVFLPSRFNSNQLTAILDRVRQRRPDLSERYTVDHLRLAASCKELELRVIEGKYEAALRTIPFILNSPLLAGEGAADPSQWKAPLSYAVQAIS